MRGVLSVVVLLLASITADAQSTKDPDQQRPGTVRVAVVNIGLIFSKYEKAQAFKQKLEAYLAPFKTKATKLTQEIKDWQKALDQRDFTDNIEPELKALIKKNQRELEDLDQDVKRELGGCLKISRCFRTVLCTAGLAAISASGQTSARTGPLNLLGWRAWRDARS
jgi:Skp family chaperone for outer membrane proteins